MPRRETKLHVLARALTCMGEPSATPSIDHTVALEREAPASSFSKAAACLALLTLIAGVAWAQLHPGASWAQLQPGERHATSRHIKVSGQRFGVTADGSAIDPDALRAAFRADPQTMREMRRERPEWAALVDGHPDGSYDTERFQHVLRESYRDQRASRKLRLHEDGTAVDPVGYLEVARAEKGRAFLAAARDVAPDLYEGMLAGDTEALQTYLLRNARRGGRPPPPPPPLPAPPTPYDGLENLHVGMSMKILTDEGEEKDVYQLAAEETEEQKWRMPAEMRCAACQAVAYQAAAAVRRRLDRLHKDELVGVAILDALYELCGDVDMWTRKYGVVPTPAGFNTFQGDGVERLRGADFSDDVMLAAKHSRKNGRKLADACLALLVGADAVLEEEQLARISQQAESAKSAARRYREELCDSTGQLCA